MARHPGHRVISYINCSAHTKALSDVICTSSNAVRIAGSFPADEPLIFAPDRHLGAWVAKQLRPAARAVAGVVRSPRGLQREEAGGIEGAASRRGGGRPSRVHGGVLQHADFIGSTTAILRFAQETAARRVIVVTEAGILHQMRKENPGKEFIPAPGADESCSCGTNIRA